MVAQLVLACPDCLTARGARAMVFSDDFLVHAVAAVLPFAVTGLVIRWVARRGRP